MVILPLQFSGAAKKKTKNTIQAGKPQFLLQTSGAFESKQGAGCFSFLEDTASLVSLVAAILGAMTEQNWYVSEDNTNGSQLYWF